MPRLPIERWLKASGASDDADETWRVVLVVEAAHGQLAHASTTAAGVRRGTRLTDARALDPGLQAVAADLGGDAELLGRLARWASRWSPLVEVDTTQMCFAVSRAALEQSNREIDIFLKASPGS